MTLRIQKKIKNSNPLYHKRAETQKNKKAAVLSAEGTALYHPTRAGAESRNLEEYLVLVPRGGRRARESKKKASTVSPRSAEHCIPPLSAPPQRAEGPENLGKKKARERPSPGIWRNT